VLRTPELSWALRNPFRGDGAFARKPGEIARRSMTSRGRLLLSWIEAAVPGEGATRIIRRDIQGDTERGYAERGRQHQQFPLVEIEHRVCQPLIGTSRGGLVGEIDIAATASAQTEYRPVLESGRTSCARAGLPTRFPAPRPRRVNESSMEPPSPIMLVNIAHFAKYCWAVQAHQAPHDEASAYRSLNARISWSFSGLTR
jgi:hypothetical protein